MSGPAPLIDTHAHLDDPRLKNRLDQVLHDSAGAGVVQIVVVATTAHNSRSVVELARSHPGLFATVGIHPNDAAEAAPGDWEVIKSLANDPVVVGLGETGLDRHWDRTPFDLQQDYFGRHLALALETDRPVVIHSRDCHADVVGQLRSLGRPIRGVLHSFTGTWNEAEEILELGLHISFAGMLTFANKALDPLRDAASRIPLDRLLVETDAPYLSPQPFRGKENEPARVIHTATRLAEIRGMTLNDLAEMTTSNARRLFRLGEKNLIYSVKFPQTT